MWIFTPGGILMPSLRPKDTIEPGDDRSMQVRSRRAVELDRFRREYCPDMGETLYTPDFDYEYRAYVRPFDFASAVSNAVLDIDYEKFKPSVIERYDDHELHCVYEDVWATVYKHQSEKYNPTYW